MNLSDNKNIQICNDVEAHKNLTELIRVQLLLNGIHTNTLLYNLTPSELYEEAIRYEKFTYLSSNGSIIVSSGAKTGRSPSDKRIVSICGLTDDIWWGEVNMPMDEKSFSIHRQTAVDFLNSHDKLFVIDGFAGWDTRYRIKIRSITTRPYHALFMINMLVRPTLEELKEFSTPDFIIYNAGCGYANKILTDNASETGIFLNVKSKELIILGTMYAGEMKKGVLTYMMYLMPRMNHLPLHSSCNVDSNDNVTFFFGLSGTGKTTLSADPSRCLIGDDEHVWTDDGVFNIEGGCYAKCNDLSEEKEPDIYNSIRFGTILENVGFNSITRVPDFTYLNITENIRASYPLNYIKNARIPAVIKSHPQNIILLTYDGFGVLPPVSRLTKEQLIYHFIMGYTSKVSGTEVGVQRCEATFSPCYGGPFLMFHPCDYGKLLEEKVNKHKVEAWLINVGMVGGSIDGDGKRIALEYTRSIVNAINNNAILSSGTNFKQSDVFNLSIPYPIKGVPDHYLFQELIWKDVELYKKQLLNLAQLFNKHFEKYTNYVEPRIAAAGPSIKFS